MQKISSEYWLLGFYAKKTRPVLNFPFDLKKNIGYSTVSTFAAANYDQAC